MNCVYLFGPSCSGKSTLGKALQHTLGDQWTYIDRDDLIEQSLCSESTADAFLDERIQLIKNKIIIDTQIPWREKRKGELYFLVLPPLKILLERDEARTLQLQRTARRAYYAKEYVKKTHHILDKRDKTEFDYCFDSSQVSVEDEIKVIKNCLCQPKPVTRVKFLHIAIAGLAFSVICVLFIGRQML